MLKAAILDYQSLSPDDLDMSLLWQLPIEWSLHDYTPTEKTADRIQNMDIVLTNKVVLDENLLLANPAIKLIIILATGTNNVDLTAAKRLNIPVCNIVAYSTESVVQQTFACLLALQSRLLEYDRAVKQGRWGESQFFGLLEFPITEVAKKTLGIIGFGAIGRRVKEVAEAFGMKVLVARSLQSPEKEQVDRVTLETLYQQADAISIHCPLSIYSENLINANAFQQMKPTAVLLNMGRGGIVNEQDLAQALKTRKIAAAATDVLTQEPPSKNHVLLDASIPNLIITPHTAWASREARQELIGQVVNILQSFAKGERVNQVKI
jgi:glycerate dehydrogenase